jgi:hypothetical protein
MAGALLYYFSEATPDECDIITNEHKVAKE